MHRHRHESKQQVVVRRRERAGRRSTAAAVAVRVAAAAGLCRRSLCLTLRTWLLRAWRVKSYTGTSTLRPAWGQRQGCSQTRGHAGQVAGIGGSRAGAAPLLLLPSQLSRVCLPCCCSHLQVCQALHERRRVKRIWVVKIVGCGSWAGRERKPGRQAGAGAGSAAAWEVTPGLLLRQPCAHTVSAQRSCACSA